MFVRESDFEEAAKLFEETKNDSEKTAENSECPKCKSKDVILKFKYNWIALFIMLISFSFTPKNGSKIKYKCKECSFVWEDEIEV